MVSTWSYMKSNFILAGLVFLFLSVLFTAPVFDNSDKWGQKDWDQFVMWNAVPHKTILEHRQVPLWNPYVNGGNVMLAHPQSAFLSPFFILVLMFGPYLGLKIQITLHVFLGLWGMFLLARHYGMRGMSSYLAAFIFMFSAVFALHLTEGHTEWLCMAFMPWLFLCYLKSLDDIRYVFGGVAFMSLILLNGSVDVFNIFNVFLVLFAGLTCIQRRSLVPVKMLALAFAGTFLLCAVKVLPMLDFLSHYPRVMEEEAGGLTLKILYHMLLNPDQETLDMLNWLDGYRMGLTNGWHEYGAYIGVIPLILCVAGMVIFFERQWPLIVSGVVMFVIAAGNGSVLNLWSLLHRLPVYQSLTVPSRYIVGFIFLAALVSALAFQQLTLWCERQKDGVRKFLRIILVCVYIFIPYNLIEMNSSIFWNAFRVDPIELPVQNFFAQRYRKARFYKEYLTNSSIYPIFLSNSGILEAYEVLQVDKGDVKIPGEPGYRGEQYFDSPRGEWEMVSFSPNRLVYDIKLQRSNILFINQNYDHGWRARGNGQDLIVSNSAGLISVVLPPGEYRLDIYYLPQSFIIGGMVSGVALVLMLIRVWQIFRKPRLPGDGKKAATTSAT